MALKLKVRQESDGITVLELEGRILVADSSQQFHQAVREQLAQGARRIVLHLGGVSYVDSSGIGEVVGAFTAARDSGGELRLAAVTPKVRDLMMMTNLNRIFDLNQSEADAIASFKTDHRVMLSRVGASSL